MGAAKQEKLHLHKDVYNGYWVSHVCDERCSEAKARAPEKDGVYAKPAGAADRTAWCIEQCDRMQLYPTDESKREMAVMMTIRMDETWVGGLKSKFPSKDGYIYHVIRKPLDGPEPPEIKYGNCVFEGHWVQVNCDQQCSEALPIHPDSPSAQDRPTDPNKKTPWCVLQCDRARITPTDPSKRLMSIIVSLGQKEYWNGTLGTEFLSKDGYVYRVIRRHAPVKTKRA